MREHRHDRIHEKHQVRGHPQIEPDQIPQPHAFTTPGTVMVMAFDTHVAKVAVIDATMSDDIASLAKVSNRVCSSHADLERHESLRRDAWIREQDVGLQRLVGQID